MWNKAISWQNIWSFESLQLQFIERRLSFDWMWTTSRLTVGLRWLSLLRFNVIGLVFCNLAKASLLTRRDKKKVQLSDFELFKSRPQLVISVVCISGELFEIHHRITKTAPWNSLSNSIYSQYFLLNSQSPPIVNNITISWLNPPNGVWFYILLRNNEHTFCKVLLYLVTQWSLRVKHNL